MRNLVLVIVAALALSVNAQQQAGEWTGTCSLLPGQQQQQQKQQSTVL
jgi:hypothetical protein